MESWISGLALHGYSVLFAAVFLAAVGLPIPAALALLIAGGASARGSLHGSYALGGALLAMIAGDTLIDRGDGLILPQDWALSRRGDPVQIRTSLLPLLDLPVEVVLPTHGLPTDRTALERALAQP